MPQAPSLATPHSGYHAPPGASRFFEGWYDRLTLPELGQTFAFMYSIEDPSGASPYSGGAAQILGPDDAYLIRTFPDVAGFWGDRHRLALGHCQLQQPSPTPPAPGWLPPEQFAQQVREGYQLSPTWHQGQLRDPVSGQVARWAYAIEPVYGWGPVGQAQRSTAGVLSQFPIFEPGWQILMAHGWATGWIEWRGQRYEFDRAPAYREKNWGAAFPKQWFWLNCNSFVDQPDLALTAGGGLRDLVGLPESVALIGVHHGGQFYEFSPWTAQVSWQISPWGQWEMQALQVEPGGFGLGNFGLGNFGLGNFGLGQFGLGKAGERDRPRYGITLRASTDKAGTALRAPMADGLVYCCRDTMGGELELELWRWVPADGNPGNVQTNSDHGDRQIVISARSHLCGLEVGGLKSKGDRWPQSWQGESNPLWRYLAPLLTSR